MEVPKDLLNALIKAVDENDRPNIRRMVTCIESLMIVEAKKEAMKKPEVKTEEKLDNGK